MNQRNTPQRRQVLNTVQQMHCHPTAEQVWHALQGTGMGRATVYRNLNILCQQGLLRRLDLPDSSARYDDTLAPHCHIVCRKCGCFLDVVLPAAPQMDTAAAVCSGFTQVEHSFVFFGICPVCQQRDAEEAPRA